MSTLFGVPPPPRPQVYEPGSAADAAYRAETYEEPEVVVVPEVDPWRRRAAVFLTFVAVSLLVIGNLATWLHFTGFDDRIASTTVAAATVDEAADLLVVPLGDEVSAIALERARDVTLTATSTPTAVDESTVRRDVDAAVRAALQSEQFRASWAERLASATARQQAIGNGAEPSDIEASGVILVLPTTTLVPQITDALVADGYTYMAGALTSAPNLEVVADDNAADHRGVIAASNLWWLLLGGAIACGAGAIYLASRRLRLGVIMAVDAAVMLAICLVLVPLIGQVVDDQAVDPDQSPLLLAAYGAWSRTLVNQTVVLMVIAVCAAIVLGVLARSRGRAERLEPDA